MDRIVFTGCIEVCGIIGWLCSSLLVKSVWHLTIRRFGSTASESFVDFLSFDFFALGLLGFCVLEPGGAIPPDLTVVYVWWVKPVEAVGNGTEN
jgi:hypothetical protein